MAKRKRKKLSSTLTWKATKGAFRLLFRGLFKASPLLLFGLIGFGIFWGIRQELYADPGFKVERLEIVPPGALPREKVEGLERLYLGKNLFRISLRKAAKELERDPKIREVRLIREFPKTLRIEITDRLPFVQIQFTYKGPYYAAGEDGVILDTGLERNDKLLLVEAEAVTDVRPEIGKRLTLPGFSNGVAVAKAFWAHPLARTETLASVRLDHLGNVTLVLRKGPELRFGRQPLKKLYTLDTVTPLLRGPDRNRIIYIELEYQDLIVRKK